MPRILLIIGAISGAKRGLLVSPKRGERYPPNSREMRPERNATVHSRDGQPLTLILVLFVF